MISIGDNAQTHFRRLLAQQDIENLGIRVKAVNPGTSRADCQLEFCEQSDLDGNEWIVECDGFNLYVDAASAKFLDGAWIDFQTATTGGQLTIKAPKLKGEVPAENASLPERVQYLIESEINPGVASHGGKVSLVEITAENAVVLRFGGGCHGCAQVSVTLKNGVEKTLREKIPEITAVIDATDHESGSNPYYKRSGCGSH